jgi:hypothetical protein
MVTENLNTEDMSTEDAMSEVTEEETSAPFTTIEEALAGKYISIIVRMLF